MDVKRTHGFGLATFKRRITEISATTDTVTNITRSLSSASSLVQLAGPGEGFFVFE